MTNKLFTFDWKFYVMLVVTLSGVLVPVFLWKADLQSKSLHFRIISQTALAPEIPELFSGIKVSVDGAVLDQPYITVIKLINDGNRPIPAADFEGSIEVMVAEGVRVVRSQLAEASPSDLRPKISLENNSLKISPLLLNSNDVITFFLVTAGGKPTFKVHARVAGIKSVQLDDSDSPKRSLVWKSMQAVIGTMLLFLYASCASVLLLNRRYEIKRITLAIGIVASGFGGSMILRRLFDGQDLSNLQINIFLSVFCGVIALLAMFVNRARDASSTS